jgi:hypothetical protein
MFFSKSKEKNLLFLFFVSLLQILRNKSQNVNQNTWRITIQKPKEPLHISEVHFYYKDRLHDFSKFNFTASSFRNEIFIGDSESGPPGKANDNDMNTFYHSGYGEVEGYTVSPGYKCCPDPNPVLIITTTEKIKIDTIKIFNRFDLEEDGRNFHNRLVGAIVTVHDFNDEVVFSETIKTISPLHKLSFGRSYKSEEEEDTVDTWSDSAEEKQLETPRQALLISGIMNRFIFRQSRIGNFESRTDVFIVLQNDKNAVSSRYVDAHLPYNNSVSTIKAFFTNLGAETVHVTVLTSEDIIDLRKRIEMDVGEDKLVELKNDSFWGAKRYHPLVVMFALRHLVFASALKFSSSHSFNYTHFLYQREDNVYFTTTPATLPTRNGKLKELCPASATIPCVAVSDNCVWDAVNDKIFFANHRGADILFSPTWKDFIAFVDAYVYLYNSKEVHNWERLQTEYHYQHWLEVNGGHDLVIHNIDFFRTELRFVHGVLCINEVYIQCAVTGFLRTPWMQEFDITIPCRDER